jgi:hypothetical protein
MTIDPATAALFFIGVMLLITNIGLYYIFRVVTDVSLCIDQLNGSNSFYTRELIEKIRK